MASESAEKKAETCRAPFIVVSPGGLITVVLKQKMAVEMSIDQAIRLINPRHKSAAAINNKGDASCIIEPLLKVSHDRDNLEVSALLGRNVKIVDDNALLFGSRDGCFRISNGKMLAAHPEFSDMSNDISVTHLFSSAYGPHLITECEMVAKNATYENFEQGSMQIRINGVKITQLSNGDVAVSLGKKYLRASALYGSMTVGTADVNMKSDGRGRCKLHHYNNFVEILPSSMLVSNRLVEGGFNQHRKVFFRATPAQFRLHDNGDMSQKSFGGPRPMPPRYECNQQKKPSTTSWKDDYYSY